MAVSAKYTAFCEGEAMIVDQRLAMVAGSGYLKIDDCHGTRECKIR
ncbi:hypothetical protein SJ05684_c04270 [Sinorhizobium sojae CCBAU 05684]|uniref:Uncharacterized protein n=1 Tax=Sinorhizobium sojae CCBAU 05684 TaxID=716928 RepID=A0A249P7J3_9HYPH|nr:hypothetical protein SJ05684_c04270 [Sinorhizobium sojae CCBAU 05684]